MASFASAPNGTREPWLHYRAVWRWHFYAGVFSIPFIIWLAITGSIYLFRPQIEHWLERPYDQLHLRGALATPEAIARAAVTAVPGSHLHFYELPPTSDGAVRVEVGEGAAEYRVYVHPGTRAILKVVEEDRRPMVLLAHLHGQLLAGRWGSYLVELAASWAVVLVLTGLFLWWPRQTQKFAGVLWVRIGKGQRLFWRDIHAVTGVWVSLFALFLVLTGLPWATGWGAYFNQIRAMTGTATAHGDWTTGRASEIAERKARNDNSLSMMSDMPDMPGMDHSAHSMAHMSAPDAYAPFNRLVPIAASLHLAYPVQIVPAKKEGASWTIKSDAQNRTLRDAVAVDPQTGRTVARHPFRQKLWLDRVVGIGIAAHEGQLFGPLNQLLGLLTAMGLVTLSVSAVVLWWRRRHVGVLGAPPLVARPRWGVVLTASVIALALYLPAMGVSLVAVVVAERFVFPRMPRVRDWLGLAQA